MSIKTKMIHENMHKQFFIESESDVSDGWLHQLFKVCAHVWLAIPGHRTLTLEARVCSERPECD